MLRISLAALILGTGMLFAIPEAASAGIGTSRAGLASSWLAAS